MRDNNDLNAMQREDAAAHAETLTHIEAVMGKHRQELGLLVESIARLNEALEHEGRNIREEIRRTARETQALLKF